MANRPYIRVTRGQVDRPGAKRVGWGSTIEVVGEDGTVIDISAAVCAAEVVIDLKSADKLMLKVLDFELCEAEYVPHDESVQREIDAKDAADASTFNKLGVREVVAA